VTAAPGTRSGAGTGAAPGPVAVIGATGSTGRRVVAALHRRGVPVVAVSRGANGTDPGDGVVEARHGDLRAPESLQLALADVAAVYVIPPTFQRDEAELLSNAAAACQRAGVPRVVLHSVLHPHCPSMSHHLRKADGEDALRRTNCRWTVLQPAMYTQTVSEVLLSHARDGVVPVPWNPASRLSAVHLGDVAEAAAVVLTEPGHDYASYELAGPAALSVTQMVASAAAASGQQLRAQQVPVGAVLPYLPGSPQAQTLGAMCREYDSHGLLGNPRVLAMLLGREPTSFADAYAQDLAAAALV